MGASPHNNFYIMGKIMDNYREQYAPLIETFVSQVEESKVPTDGLPQPHLPIIGDNYEKAKYKFAFFGMETYGWCPLTDFISNYHKAAEAGDAVIDACNYRQFIEDGEYLGCRNNTHTGFWDFLIQFLSAFYHITPAEFEQQHKELHNSFVWGNTNALERYSVTSQGEGVSPEVYDKVKEYSRIFDDAGHMLKTLRPDVLIVLNWSEAEEWLTKWKDTGNVVHFHLNDHLEYYYIRETNTHVFWTAHPRWLSMNLPFDTIIPMMIDKMREFCVWDQLPESPADWEATEPDEVYRGSIGYKRDLIKNVADFCFANNLQMSGQELAALFNRNGVLTQYDTDYAGGRGIYTLIRNVWGYYYYDRKDYLTASHIAQAFVKQDGTYAYA